MILTKEQKEKIRRIGIFDYADLEKNGKFYRYVKGKAGLYYYEVSLKTFFIVINLLPKFIKKDIIGNEK